MAAIVLIGRGMYRDAGASLGGTGLVVTTVVNGTTVDVSWTEDTMNTTGQYFVQRCSVESPVVGSGPQPELVQVVDAPTLTWTDPSPDAGDNFYFVNSEP